MADCSTMGWIANEACSASSDIGTTILWVGLCIIGLGLLYIVFVKKSGDKNVGQP